MSQKQVVTRIGGTLTRNALAGSAIGATGTGFAVPTSKEWELLAVVFDVVCTATVGNRVFIVSLFDTANNEWVSAASASVTAGQTCGFDVGFGNVGAPSTTVRRNLANTGNVNVMVREMCPIDSLFAGWIVKIDDVANIDNADAVTGYMFFRQYEA